MRISCSSEGIRSSSRNTTPQLSSPRISHISLRICLRYWEITHVLLARMKGYAFLRVLTSIATCTSDSCNVVEGARSEVEVQTRIGRYSSHPVITHGRWICKGADVWFFVFIIVNIPQQYAVPNYMVGRLDSTFYRIQIGRLPRGCQGCWGRRQICVHPSAISYVRFLRRGAYNRARRHSASYGERICKLRGCQWDPRQNNNNGSISICQLRSMKNYNSIFFLLDGGRVFQSSSASFNEKVYASRGALRFF